VKFAFIRAEKASFPVEVLCRILGVSRSGYYAWEQREPSQRALADQALSVEIIEIHKRSRETYGAPRVHDELRDRGHRISRKRVERLMRELGLMPKRQRLFKVTTDSNHVLPVAPNVVQRAFTVDAPNKVWVGDITYVRTREGWLYLAAIIDLFSRTVVGWATSDRLDRTLVLDALELAIGRREKAPEVHHTDRGCQYASGDYRARLQALGIVCSMSRKGDCWDNAVSESFFATLKTELVHHEDFATRQQAHSALFDYIEVFYNRQRKHSFLGYATPEQVEKQFTSVNLAA
jgi:transposase InsO family protein